MRKFIIYCLLLTCSLTTKAQVPESIKRTILQKAINICNDTTGIYDYYYHDQVISHIYRDSDSPLSTQEKSVFVFVDMEPRSGWEHECKYLNISIKSNSFDVQDSIVPPSDMELMPLSIRSENNDIEAFQLPRMPQSNDGDDAMRTYAVILNGGMNINANEERFWNDCSFMYQTLRNIYNIPKSHIKVLHADGTDPAPDLRLNNTEELVNSNLDLDNDSIPDIEYPATTAALESVFNDLSDRITEDDILFIYIIGHGGKTIIGNKGYLYLWNGEKLYSEDLADLLEPINAQAINIVMGQCYSGSFINELSDKTRAITTATSADKKSYGHEDVPFSSFLYYWTSAIAKQDPLGNSVNADYDSDGHISLSEAFEYAYNNNPYSVDGNRFGNEIPQFDVSVGVLRDDLAFDRIPKAVDLYLRDNIEDTGKEPNTSDNNAYWSSPDLYLRMQDDGFTNTRNQVLHIENPESDEADFYIYVNIHNRGTKDYNPREGKKYLHLFVTNVNGRFALSKLKGNSLYDDEIGKRVRVKPLNDVIPAGDSILYEINVNMTDNFQNCVNSHNDIPIATMGYLSDYMTMADVEDYEPYKLTEYLQARKASNDLALRNHIMVPIMPGNGIWQEKIGLDIMDSCKVLVRSSNSYISNIASAKFLPHNPSQTNQISTTYIPLNQVNDMNPLYFSSLGETDCLVKFDFTDLTNANQITDGDTFTILQVDDATQEVIGGLTFVFTETEGSHQTESNSVISNMNVYDNTLEIYFCEPIEDALISISTSSPFIRNIEKQSTGTSTSETIELPTDFNGLLMVNIMKDQEVIDSKKIFRE